jgi:hypothetical protein
MTTKKHETFRAERKPETVLDATPKDEPKEAPKVDPTQCQCSGVTRRYDGDGLLGTNERGVNEYQCSVCGKRYH